MLFVAFGESTTTMWYNRFKKGWEDVNDGARPGILITSTIAKNIETVKKMILNNRRITIREIADDAGISFCSFQAIFTDVLDMKQAAANIVPNLLNFE